VDELYSATVGGLSAEAMATGNAVLTRYMEEYSKVPAGCPAINTNVFTLKDNLRRMIQNVDERKAIAARGRPYAESVNDHVKVCGDILSWLGQADSLEYDFHPAFIQTYSVPNEILAAEKKEAKHKRAEFFKTLLATGVTKRASPQESRDDASTPAMLPRSIGKLRKWLTPIVGIAALTIFIYWLWDYRQTIRAIFENLGAAQLIVIAALLAFSGVLTAATFALIVRSKGYRFGIADAYHSLNYSQLASMIPGGIWGFAGLAGALWSKGISKADSLLAIILHTIVMLTGCAIVGITGLASTFGWPLALISLLPFVILAVARGPLDGVRKKFLPESSNLPSAFVMVKALLLGIAVWAIASACFAWLLYSDTVPGAAAFWKSMGAYATGYLGGYIALFAPSGLGVSEGLVALLLAPEVGTEKALSAAIAFRIVNTFVIWCNILVTVIVSNKKGGASSTQP